MSGAIYTTTKSRQKGLFLLHKAWNMTNDCVSVTKTLMMGLKLMTERYKKRILTQKVKVSAKIR